MKYKDQYIKDYVQKMLHALAKNGSLIIGYDFDDTVHPTHEFSKIYVEEVQQVLRDLKATGKCRFILITCREDSDNYPKGLEYVEQYLFDNNLPYNAINQNLPWSIPDDPRKIYCNIMIDDKCGLPLSLEILKILTSKIKEL